MTPVRSICALLLALGAIVTGCDSGSDSTDTSSRATTTTDASAADVDWPYFGRVEQRTHYIDKAPDPPFHMLWDFFAKQLIEFPPAVNGGFMYVVNKTGQVFVVDVETGKSVRQSKLGNDVTGPAYSDGTLYLAQTNGSLTALEPREGRQLWNFKADSELESSPLVVGDRVYFGSDDGSLYALDARTGKQVWRADLGNDVKASPSFDDGTIYVGDYEGVVWAVDADSGHKEWNTDTTQLEGGGTGGFYSSPAIAFDRVYEARTDGTMYALDADSGKLSWRFPTSNSIYGSPAVADISGTGPTVYIGSYDHQLYALDAESGAKRWVFNVGGVVPGTPTVVHDTVYTSSFQNRKTFGLDAGTGKRVFEWGSAGFTPVISDGERVFLTGFQTVWAFDAKDDGEQQARSVDESGPTPRPPSG